MKTSTYLRKRERNGEIIDLRTNYAFSTIGRSVIFNSLKKDLHLNNIIIQFHFSSPREKFSIYKIELLKDV
jgi:hypothetical protein